MQFNDGLLLPSFLEIIIPLIMPDSSHHNLEGLISCFQDFHGAYCARKLIEMLVSAAFLIVGCIVLGMFIYKYRITRPYWLSSILLVCVLNLTVNIFFCFFNNTYWLYSLQSFTYSIYYLILVSYICYSYVLKHNSIEKEDLMARLNYNLNQKQPNYIHKIIYLVVVALISAFYLAVFIGSVVYEVKYDDSELRGQQNSKVQYCEEIWYLILDILCIVLSVVVVVVMVKSQADQYKKLLQFGLQQKRRESYLSSSGSSSDKGENETRTRVSLEGRKINNPFKCLWIWVGINVLGQIFDLVQSGLLLQASPPQCYMAQNKVESNILYLFFVFMTAYTCFGATYWYIIYVKLVNEKIDIDRTILFSAEMKIEGNIELFHPSKQERVSFQI